MIFFSSLGTYLSINFQDRKKYIICQEILYEQFYNMHQNIYMYFINLNKTKNRI